MKRLCDVTALIAVPLICSSCAVFYWNVPVANLPASQSKVPTDVPPEAMCALIRQGAIDHRTADEVLGSIFAVVGAGATATGTALVTRGNNSEKYEGSWAGVIGVGVIATAVGIYFLVKSGSDRQEYWSTNAAVAQIRADYAQYPVALSPEVSAALDKFQSLSVRHQADMTNDKLTDETNAAWKDYSDKRAILEAWNLSAEGHAQAVAAAAKTKMDASKAAATAAQDAAFATMADAQLTAAAAQQKDATVLIPLYVKARQDAIDAHSAARKSAEAAADAAAKATDAMNLLLGQQLAWTDCSKAMQTISNSDVAAATALVTALGSAKGAATTSPTTASSAGSAGAAAH